MGNAGNKIVKSDAQKLLYDHVVPKNLLIKRRRSNVVEKFRKFSDSVWVSFEAVVTEKTIKEE